MFTQKCLLVFCCLLFGLTSFAQKKPTIHEVGISISSDFNLGLIYKTGRENSIFHLQALFLNGSHESQPSINNTNLNNNRYGFGISLGLNLDKMLLKIYS